MMVCKINTIIIFIIMIGSFSLATAEEQQQTIELVSAAPGLPEGTLVASPFIYAINGVDLPTPAPSVVTKTERWAFPFPNASYISSCPDCGSNLGRCRGGYTPASPKDIAFVETFDLPKGFSESSLLIQTTNDDAANVYLNNHFIGRAKTCCGPYPGQKTTTLRTADQSFFVTGKNELRYELENFNPPCPTSMAYVAIVSFSVAVPVETIVDIDPHTLNLRSNGEWISAYLEVPDEYNIYNIKIETIKLLKINKMAMTNPVFAEVWPSNIGDYDNDGISDLMVKFNRNKLVNIFKLLNFGDEVELQLEGEFIDGTLFTGSDKIKIIYERGIKK